MPNLKRSIGPVKRVDHQSVTDTGTMTHPEIERQLKSLAGTVRVIQKGGDSAPLFPMVEQPVGSIDGTNKVFTLSGEPVGSWLVLMQCNALMSPYSDYVLSGSTITYSQAPQLDDNHVAWYMRRKGTAPGSLTFGKARAFGGSDYMDWGAHASLKLLGDMSFGCWIKLSSATAALEFVMGHGRVSIGTEPGIVDAGDNFVYALRVAGTSGAWDMEYFHEYNSFTSPQTNTFATAIANDTWVYIGFSRDDTAKTVTFFVGDGSSMSQISSVYSYSHSPTATVTNKFVMGSADLSLHALKGSLQQHYVWGRSISITEHTAAMLGSPSGSNLVLSCAMGNTPEVDVSSSGLTAALTGTSLVAGHV